jgi:hypothetical protein
MIKNMEKEHVSSVVAINIQAIGITINKPEKVYFIGQMEIDMKVII